MSRLISLFFLAVLTSSFLSVNSHSNNNAEKMADESKAEETTTVDNQVDSQQEEKSQTEKVKTEMPEEEKPAGEEVDKAEEMVVEEEPEPLKDVLGKVVNIAENAIVIKNERDNREYKLFSESTEMLQDIEPGYRVEAFYTDNMLVDLTILGTPAEAELTIIKVK